MTFLRIFEYLRYRWRALNAHGIHSPFVFDFYNKVLHGVKKGPDIDRQIHKRYLENHAEVRFIDPKSNQPIKTTISHLARKSWSGKSFAYFLLKLCEWTNAKSFLETGTSLGITLSVVSYATSLEKLHSIEGSMELADLARKLNFVSAKKDLKIIHGLVQNIFEKVLNEAQPDIIFLDADHRSETIFFYLDCIRKYDNAVKAIVIHDIYWSEDMKKAWVQICNDPQYSLTIDCFHMGIIFPDRKMEKQHFTLKY